MTFFLKIKGVNMNLSKISQNISRVTTTPEQKPTTRAEEKQLGSQVGRTVSVIPRSSVTSTVERASKSASEKVLDSDESDLKKLQQFATTSEKKSGKVITTLRENVQKEVEKRADIVFSRHGGEITSLSREQWIEENTERIVKEMTSNLEIGSPVDYADQEMGVMLMDEITKLTEEMTNEPDKNMSEKRIEFEGESFVLKCLREPQSGQITIKLLIPPREQIAPSDEIQSVQRRPPRVIELHEGKFPKEKDIASMAAKGIVEMKYIDNPHIVTTKKTVGATFNILNATLLALKAGAQISERTETARLSTEQSMQVSSLGQSSYQMLETGLAGASVGFGALTLAVSAKELLKLLQEGKNDQFLVKYKEYKQQIENNPALTPADTLKAAELEKIANSLKISYASRTFDSTLNVLSGVASVVSGAGTLSHVTVVAGAATGAGGGVLIVGGLAKSALAIHGLHKTSKRRDKLETMQEAIAATDNTKNKELVDRFAESQIHMLRNKKVNDILNLTTGTSMVVGGALLIASVAAGAASFGIGAAAVLGGTAVAVGTIKGVQYFENKKFERIDSKKAVQDMKEVSARIAAGEDVSKFDQMGSIAGIVLEIYQEVKKEQEAKDLAIKEGKEPPPTPLSDHVVVQYFGVDPSDFIHMMDGLEQVFLQEAEKQAALEEQENMPKLAQVVMVIPED